MKRVFLILFLALPRLAWAVPTFDAETDSGLVFGEQTSVDMTHDVGAGCINPIIVVTSNWYAFESDVFSSITIGGATPTQVNYGNLDTILWGRVDYRVGVSGTVAITLTFSGSTYRPRVFVRSYCNVNQSTAIGTADIETAATGDPTLSVASTTSDLVIDSVLQSDLSSDTVLAAAGGQTVRENVNMNGWFTTAESDKAGAAGTTSMVWNKTGSDLGWLAVGVALKPASAPATLVRHRPVTQ